MTTLSEIKARCATAAHDCQREWRKDNGTKGCLFSRGRFITVCYLDERGQRCQFFEGETRDWDGTLKDLRAAVQEALLSLKGRPVEVCIFGGYDFADSPNAYWQWREYDPMVAEWSIDIPFADLP